MTVLLLIIIVVILSIFLGGKVLEDIGKLLELIVTGIGYVIKGIVILIKKIISGKKRPKKVIAYCPCSNSFETEPRQENGWLVRCPKCGRTLRVDISKKK